MCPSPTVARVGHGKMRMYGCFGFVGLGLWIFNIERSTRPHFTRRCKAEIAYSFDIPNSSTTWKRHNSKIL